MAAELRQPAGDCHAFEAVDGATDWTVSGRLFETGQRVAGAARNSATTPWTPSGAGTALVRHWRGVLLSTSPQYLTLPSVE
jgi:hypothetical protein